MLGRNNFALFTSCVYTIIILGQSLTTAWEFKFETSATMEFPEVTVIGSLDEPEEGFKEIANNTVDVLERNPSITFKCVINDKETKKICCDTENTALFTRGCSDFPCIANQTILQNKTKSKEYNFTRKTERGGLWCNFFLILIPVIIGIIYKLWTKYMGWKQYDKLSPREIRDFISGKQGSNSEIVNMKANAIPYDRRYELSSKELRIGKIVGQGAFGIGRVGSYKKLTVAIMNIKPFSDIIYFKSLLSELKLLTYMEPHVNIVRLIGAQTKYLDRRQVYIVTDRDETRTGRRRFPMCHF